MRGLVAAGLSLRGKLQVKKEKDKLERKEGLDE